MEAWLSKKMKWRFSEFPQDALQIVKFFACAHIDHKSRLLEAAPRNVDSLNEFRDKRYRKIVDAEESQIFKRF